MLGAFGKTRTIVCFGILGMAAWVRAGTVCLFVGCDYANDEVSPPLQCARNDVSLILSVLDYDKTRSQTLLSGSGKVRRADIESAFAEAAAKCKPEDTFVFFFSGHGDSSRDGDSLLIPEGLSKRDFDPQRDYVSVAKLRSLLDRQCKAKQKLLILDACHSGGSKGPKLGAMLPATKGTYTLAASKLNQKAYQTKDGYSIFTVALVDVLSSGDAVGADGRLNMKVLEERVTARVEDLCKKNNHGIQTPVFLTPPDSGYATNVSLKRDMIPNETFTYLKKPITEITELATLKKGIGVILACASNPQLADRATGTLTEELLKTFPVFGPERSRELATIIDAASTLQGRQQAMLTDRYLLRGTILSQASVNSIGRQQIVTVEITIQVSVVDLEGNLICAASSDKDGVPVRGAGSSEQTASAKAISLASKNLMQVLLPKLQSIRDQ